VFSHENSVVVLLVCVFPSWLKSPVKIDSFVADPEPTYVSVVSKFTRISNWLVNVPEPYQTPIIGSSGFNSKRALNVWFEFKVIVRLSLVESFPSHPAKK
jgi:hypothetical protein